jgi:hypothetical protein
LNLDGLAAFIELIQELRVAIGGARQLGHTQTGDTQQARYREVRNVLSNRWWLSDAVSCGRSLEKCCFWLTAGER